MLKIIKTALIFLTGSLLGSAIVVWAFNNPTQAPPNGSGILVIDSSNNVGIGIAPLAKLHIGVLSSVDAFLITNSGNTSLVVKNTTGNVGINNFNPAYKLDVNGDANISGKLTVSQLCLSGSCKTSWPGPGSGGVISVFNKTYNGYVCSGTPYGGGGSCAAGTTPVNTSCFPRVPGIAGTVITYCIKN